MFDFKVKTHTWTGRPKVEVWRDGVFVATIYGHEDGLRFVSKYLEFVLPETNTTVAVRLGTVPHD